MTELRAPYDHTAFRHQLSELILIAGVFYALAFLRLASSADAFVFLFVVAIFRPAIRPHLLLIAASVQDAPGLAYVWSYVLFVSIAALVIGQHAVNLLVSGNTSRESGGRRALFFVWLVALAVILYAIVVSWAQSELGGYPQSPDRPYYAVGGLMILMVTAGYVSARDIVSRSRGFLLFGATALIAATHTLLIGVIQVFAGPEIYRSAANLDRILLSSQLTDAGVLGFARINGTFLSPNAFGYAIIMFCLVAIVVALRYWPRLVIRAFFIFGAAAVLLSASKALATFYIVFGAILYWGAVSKIRFSAYVAAGALAAIFLLPAIVGEILLAAFRLDIGLGSREYAWRAVIDNLAATDWVFGVGLSAWPVFFEQHIGIALADPHTLILSVPGTFGIAGIALYGAVLLLLLDKYLSRNSSRSTKLAILGLLVLLLGKDMVSIPALLGNTIFTYFVWLCLALLLMEPKIDDSR